MGSQLRNRRSKNVQQGGFNPVLRVQDIVMLPQHDQEVLFETIQDSGEPLHLQQAEHLLGYCILLSDKKTYH